MLSVWTVVLQYVGGIDGVDGSEGMWTRFLVLMKVDASCVAAAVCKWESSKGVIGVEGNVTRGTCNVKVENVIIYANGNGDGWESGCGGSY